MISIIMAVYNESEQDVRKALDSILNQDYTSFELIIVADNPQNIQVIHQLQLAAKADSRIKLVLNEKNLGLGNSLNKAIHVAQFDLVARMDADDIALPNRLQTLVDNFQSSDDLVFSRYEIIDQNGRHVKNSGHMNYTEPQIYRKMQLNNFICHPSVMFKKESVLKVGGYSDLRVSEDVDLWIRMLKSGMHFHGIDKILMKYRIRNNSMTTSNLLRTHFAKKFIRTSYASWDGLYKAQNDSFQREFSAYEADPDQYNRNAEKIEKIIHGKLKLSGMFRILRIAVRDPLLFSITKDRILSQLIRPKKIS